MVSFGPHKVWQNTYCSTKRQANASVFAVVLDALCSPEERCQLEEVNVSSTCGIQGILFLLVTQVNVFSHKYTLDRAIFQQASSMRLVA